MPDNLNANIFIGVFTMCHARLRLFFMRLVWEDGTPGQRRLWYGDTGSLLYVSEEGCPEPKLGNYLGDLTSELKEIQCILEYCWGSPKNYAYVTNGDEEACKVRGFTLNHANAKLINFDTVKELVFDLTPSESCTVLSPSKITRDKKLCNICPKGKRKCTRWCTRK